MRQKQLVNPGAFLGVWDGAQRRPSRGRLGSGTASRSQPQYKGRSPKAPALTFASYLRLARHLKEPDFVPLYIRYRVARILRCVAARTISDFLAGLHSLLALPKGDAD
jgi:hypothetical protein